MYRNDITDEMVLKLYTHGLSAHEMARALKCSRDLIHDRLNKYNLKSNGKGKKERRIDKWLEQQQNKHYYCACGCGEEIGRKREYQRKGVPKYIKNHENRGKNNSNYGKCKENSLNWKGGPEATYQRAYLKAKKDPKRVLSSKMSRATRMSLKNKGGSKKRRHWEDLVGYKIESLEKHLRSTVPDSYTWDDFLHGDLHIDHIVPVNVFNFKSPKDEDFKRCWALSNLRFLPRLENQKKHTKLFEVFQPTFALRS